VFHFDADMLDDNASQKARSLGLSVPKSFHYRSQQVLDFDFSNEKRKYILKSILTTPRRHDQAALRHPEETTAFVNSLPISEEKPWIMGIHPRKRILYSQHRQR